MLPFKIPDRVNTLPWKLEEVVIPTKSLSSGGLVIDIQNPDYDLRYKIVKAKIDELK